MTALQAFKQLKRHALGKPGAWEDHPWEHTVFKAGKKIFVFLDVENGELSGSVKLPHSGDAALLTFRFCEPTGYGLGKSGWVSFSFPKGEAVPVDLLREWIDESYAAVAPKRVAKGKRGPSASN